MAPSRPPASSNCETCKSNSGTASGSLPAAMERTATRKASTESAISVVKSDRSSDIEQPPPLERAPQSDLVGVLQVSPHGKPAGEPGDLEAERLHHASKVRGGGLPLQIGVGGQ